MRGILLALLFVLSLMGATQGEKTQQTPKPVLDPVYHIDISKHPRFEAKIVLKNGKEIRFCCPKSMFAFYLRPFDYPEYNIKSELDFKNLYVKDFLSGDWIKAEGALYLFGSRMVGPKGDDLIPVRNKDALNIFRLKYGGTRVLTFPDVIHKGMGLIKYLDMP